MNPKAGSNPVGCKLVRVLITNENTQAFERLEAPFQESNSVLRPDANHGDMIVVNFIVWLFAVRLFAWCYHPSLSL